MFLFIRINLIFQINDLFQKLFLQIRRSYLFLVAYLLKETLKFLKLLETGIDVMAVVEVY